MLVAFPVPRGDLIAVGAISPAMLANCGLENVFHIGEGSITIVVGSDPRPLYMSGTT